MPKFIYKVLKDMVTDGPLPAKSVAKMLGKPYPTFMRELNGSDSGAKFGIEHVLPLMQACESIAPLRFLASRMECRVVSMKDCYPDKESLHEELLDTYSVLTAYHKAILDRLPLEEVAELREQLLRQVQKDFMAYAKELSEEGGGTSATDERDALEGGKGKLSLEAS